MSNYDRVYKQVSSGETCITIYHDDDSQHPWVTHSTRSVLAMWEESEIFNSYLPEITEDNASKVIESKEDLQNWIRGKRNKGLNIVVHGLKWWGVVQSDAHILEIVGGSIPDVLNTDGIIGAICIAGKESIAELSDIALQELKLLNAYLGDAVFRYTISTICPTCKQWMEQDSDGGYFHSLDRDNGDREMFTLMFENQPMTKEFRACYEMLFDSTE